MSRGSDSEEKAILLLVLSIEQLILQRFYDKSDAFFPGVSI
jgi:hypothetical protein